jgi:hypothetical protein
METTIFSSLFSSKKPPKSILEKKVNLIPVQDRNSFEDLTLTRDFIDFIDVKIKMNADALISGSWEDETQARDLVGYIRACEEIKVKYKNLYKALYSR